MRSRRRFVLAAGTALALLATACGSSTKKASAPVATTTGATTTTTSASATNAGSSDTSDIVVEGLAQLSFYPGLDTAFQARITRFNNQGGVNGRKIKFLGVQDTGNDPARAQSEAQALVLKDHVFAVAPVASEVVLGPVTDFLIQNHTPFFGWAVSPNWCNTPWGFGVNGCLEPQGEGSTTLPKELLQVEGRPASQIRVAIIGADNPGASASEAQVGGGFKRDGFNVVYNKSPLPVGGATDYTPYVQALLAVKPDVIFEDLDFASTVGINGAMKAAGFKGAMYSPGVTYAPSVLQSQATVAAALDGEYDNVEFATAEESNSPAVQQIDTDLQAIGKPAGVTLGAAVGYWTADQLIAMLQAAAAKGGTLTPDSFDQTINAGFTWNPSPAGGACPQKWPDAHTAGIVGGIMLQVQGNKFVVKEPFSCFPNAPFTS
jgi:branched-chain amino acid transport system substrate-binding protein